MEKDGACKMDRQNKNAVVLERVGEGRIMLEMIKKRERNWPGQWLRRNCLLKDALDQSFSNFSIACNPFKPKIKLWNPAEY